MGLESKDLVAGYGRTPVLHELSVSVPDGSITAILGPNGAGKSTLLKALAALLPLMAGSRTFAGQDYSDRNASWAARAGIALVPQTDAVFADLSVLENLQIGALHRSDAGAAIDASLSKFPILRERARQPAGSLSGGERQLLAVSCALLMEPAVLLLDEPTTGLAPMAAAATAELIGEVVSEGTAVVWVVEQMPELALQRAKTAYVIEAGQVRYDGEASELLDRDRLESLVLQQA